MTRQERKQVNEGKKYINNRGEEFIVVTYNGSESVLVEFTESKKAKWTRMDTIRNKSLKDPSRGRSQPSVAKSIVGQIFVNAIGLSYRILKQEGPKSFIEFENTENRKWINTDNAKLGKARDEFHLSVLGIAYIGKSNKNDPLHREKYNLWYHMLTRCLGLGDFPDSYKNTTIAKSWKCFANFQIDVEKFPGYDKWKQGKDVELDKDLFSNGKGYYPESCAFIDSSLNVKIRGMTDAELDIIKRDVTNEHI